MDKARGLATFSLKTNLTGTQTRRELLSVSDHYPPPPSNLVLKVCLKCPFLPSIIHRLLSLPSIPIQLNDYEPRKGKKIGVTISFNNHRLFVGNIPKNRDRDELLEEFTKHARKGQKGDRPGGPQQRNPCHCKASRKFDPCKPTLLLTCEFQIGRTSENKIEDLRGENQFHLSFAAVRFPGFLALPKIK